MIYRRLVLFFALLAGIAASQLPEFAQQYRQRLGGALDELKAIVQQFDSDGVAAGMDRESAIKRLTTDTDAFVRQRGTQMSETVARMQRLNRQAEGFAQAGPIARLPVMAKDFDPTIARRAYESFEPAAPLTWEGLITALGGFFAALFGLKLVGWPVRRAADLRRQRAVAMANRPRGL
jgi:hypothetical protein